MKPIYVSSYRLTRPGEKEAFGPRLIAFADSVKHAPGCLLGTIEHYGESYVYQPYPLNVPALSDQNLQTILNRIRYLNTRLHAEETCQAHEEEG